MKKWSVGGLVLCMVLGAHARMWTNSDGKQVDAELVRVMGGKAYLRPAGKSKLYPFEISSLSQADRDYINRFRKEAEEKAAQKKKLAREVLWNTDFTEALAEAEETGYPILFLYTAPSWCGWCRVLENNVFNKTEFEEYARMNLVLYVADFSDRKEGGQWKRDNEDLVDKYPIKGYPRTYILSPAGKRLGVIGGAEKEWGPQDFIEMIEKRREK